MGSNMASGGFESLAGASLEELRKWKGDFRARELQASAAQQVLVQLSKTTKAETKQKAAEEKAAEIAVAAEEEFNITRLQLLEAEKARVRREFERREGTIEVKKKVRWAGGVWRGEVEWGGRVSGGCSPRACLLAVRFACTPPIPPPAAAAYLAGPCRWSTASS